MSRLALALLIAALASGAHAQDRLAEAAPELRGAEGWAAAKPRPLLTWPSKEARLRGRVEPVPPPQAVMAPEPLAGPPPAADPPILRAARQLAPPAPTQPRAPPVRQAAIAPPPVPPAVAAPADDYASRLAAAKRRDAARLAAQTAVAPSPRSAAAAGTYDPQRPRRYSVGREFGVAPDPIRMPDPSVLAFSAEVGAAFAAQNDRSGDDSSLNPADRDQIEQASQDDARRETRQKARDKAAAAKK